MAAAFWVKIPPEARNDGLWFGRLDDEGTRADSRLWLEVQTSRDEAAVDTVGRLKIASWSEIAGLVGSNDTGVAAGLAPIAAGGPLKR